MSAGLLLLVAAVYVWVAIGFLRHGRPGMALAFVAYAISNLGFAWEAWKP
jgi:hypothetical protein